jgi:site-specific DNA-methyltransferase (adenine-specific)
VFIEWLTTVGDVVYDPFCGRGTAPLEACRLGRVGLGSDANPLACVLTAAKTNPPALDAVALRLKAIENSMPASRQGSAPADIEMLYTRNVLRQLSWLRIQLDTTDVVDRFIMATILGMMHANYKPGSPARGFSISMPNTFSMSPGYVRDYIREHQLVPPEVNVFQMALAKAQRMGIPGEQATRGDAWTADARTPGRDFEPRARLVFTSPPYLGVIKYGKYNWIRLWMLGSEPRGVDTALVATTSLLKYLAFIGEVLAGLELVVDSSGFVCLMIGDVTSKSKKSTLNLAETVWKNAAKPAGWRLLGIINDQLPEQHKVSRIWGREKKGCATKVDRILILAPPGSDHSLPPVPRGFSWNSATNWTDNPNSGA